MYRSHKTISDVEKNLRVLCLRVGFSLPLASPAGWQRNLSCSGDPQGTMHHAVLRKTPREMPCWAAMLGYCVVYLQNTFWSSILVEFSCLPMVGQVRKSDSSPGS